LDSFLSFLKIYEEKKVHNMFFLMLDPRLKTLCLIFSLIDREQGQLLKNMIKNLDFLCFLNIIDHLHPLVEFERHVVEQEVEKGKSLDIFEMTTNTSGLATQLVKSRLLIFKHYQVMFKTSNAHYIDEKNMRICF
jgi:hypothetical protein